MLPTFLSMLALAGEANASVLSVAKSAQFSNVLRETVRVRTSEPVRFAVRVWPSAEGRGAAWVTDYTDRSSTDGTVTLTGLRPETRYQMEVVVRPEEGSLYTYSNHLGFQTAALPSWVPTVSVSTSSIAPDFNYLLIDSATSDTNQGLIEILDPTGQVVWYQKAPSADEDVSALWYDEDQKEVYAVIGGGRVMGWALDGTQILDFDTSTVLDGYPHHEVQIVDDVLYTIAARESIIEGRALVEDGILGYDFDGNLVYEWWAHATGGMTPSKNAPISWETAGTGYWATIFPHSIEWLHSNSLQVRDEGGVMKAYIDFRDLSQLGRIDMATGAVDWLLGSTGSTARESAGDYSLTAAAGTARWWHLEHHAHFEDDGLLYMFDNGDGRQRSRALAVDVDESTGVATIEREVDLSEFMTGGFTGVCTSRGGTFRTPLDHLLITCGTRGLIADYDAHDTLVWSLSLTGARGLYRATPVYDLGH